MKQLVAFVPIKFESERLQNKNFLMLGGKPMCRHIFDTLLKIKIIEEVYVFCSNPEINKFLPVHPKMKFIKRNPELDSPQTKGLDICHAFAKEVPSQYYVLAHATSPLISKTSIIRGILGVTYGEYDSAHSIRKEQTYAWYQNQPINYQLTDISRTQDINPIMIETSAFYIFKNEVLTQQNRRIGNNPLLVETSKIESIDIDTREDFVIASAIIEKWNNENRRPNELPINTPLYNGEPIKLVVLDFDGTMSDGKIYLRLENAREIQTKCYNCKDGHKIKQITQKGIPIAIISGNCLDFFLLKALKLGIEGCDLIDKCHDKITKLEKLATKYNIEMSQIAYMGDDLNDLECMKAVGLSGCPADAQKEILPYCSFVSQKRGGEGAVREFLEYIFN